MEQVDNGDKSKPHMSFPNVRVVQVSTVQSRQAIWVHHIIMPA